MTDMLNLLLTVVSGIIRRVTKSLAFALKNRPEDTAEAN